MPMYFFHVKNGGPRLAEDEEGSNHFDYASARREAEDGLRCLTIDAIRSEEDATRYSIEIADSVGTLIGTVDAQSVLEARYAAA